MSNASHIIAVQPRRAIEGGRIRVLGSGFGIDGGALPAVWIGDRQALVTSASSTSLGVVIPQGLAAGRHAVRADDASGELAEVEVGSALATGLHQVDSPIFDVEGNLYATYSGSRGQQVPASIFRVRPNGTRETFSTSVANPTSMAVAPDGRLYVSSRFEGTVYRVNQDGSADRFAGELGTACGLAFAPDGTLFVGDRSGTIFKVDQHGHSSAFVSIPASVAAFHLALGADGTLYVTAPTLASRDAVYQVSTEGVVSERVEHFGRPQGLAVEASGALLVVEALAGASGVFRLRAGHSPELLVAGVGLVGVACAPEGGLVVSSGDTAYLFARPA